MKYSKIFALWFLGIFLLVGCSSSKNVVVLLPDPDGNVGEVTIDNAGGSQTISQAGHAVYVKDSKTAPEEPVLIDRTEIENIFGEVLAIEPQLPQTFILYFKMNSTELSEASRKRIPEILNTIHTRNSQDLSVIGHADSTGDKQFNFDLSLQRALAIRELLISEGVAQEFIETTSHGETMPLIQTEDDTPEPLNRRVEIVIR